MKRTALVTVFSIVLASAAVWWLYAQVVDPFYESTFDGAWAGTVRMATESGLREFPLVLNLNDQGAGGIGFALLSDDLTLAPTGYTLFPIRDFIRRGLKFSLKIDTTSAKGAAAEELFTHTLVMRFIKAKKYLRGTFKSTDPDLKTGRVMLYRQGIDRFLQKSWQGTVKIDKVKTPVLLHMFQQDEIGADAAAVTDVTGFGFIGTDYGKLSDASFDGSRLIGTLILSQQAVSLDLKVNGFKLKGPFTRAAFKSIGSLLPAGTRGKTMALTKATPVELVIGECNTATLLGRNMEPGVMVHVDRPPVHVDGDQNQTKKKILVCLTPDETMGADLQVSVRVTGLDGRTVDLIGVFTTMAKEDPITVRYSQDIQPVFNQSCAVSGCHTGSSPSQGLNLSSGAAYGNIVNVPSNQRSGALLVVPFEPMASYLIRKIQGSNITGSRMPLGRPPLSVEVIARFENWVREGSLNN